jgi:hypothetical protein
VNDSISLTPVLEASGLHHANADMTIWREIPETQAEGEILALYEDIRAVTEIPLVNLVFRHLATIPRGLSWAWTTMRPLYESGAAAALGAAIIRNTDFSKLPPIPNEYFGAAGLSTRDVNDIAGIIDYYIRGNAMNLLAVSALCRSIDGTAPPMVGVLSRGSIGSTKLPPFDRTMRPILSLDALDERTRAAITLLNKIGESNEPDSITPSLYRHLAYWPSFLCLAGVYLLLPDANGSLATATAAVRKNTDDLAAEICGSLRAPRECAPDVVDLLRIRAAAGHFAEVTIPRLLPICVLLRRALPEVPN